MINIIYDASPNIAGGFFWWAYTQQHIFAHMMADYSTGNRLTLSNFEQV